MHRHSAILNLSALLLAQAAPAQDTPEDPNALLADLAAQARSRAPADDFEAFRDSVTYLPETGKYYVNGDEPIRNEKLLREFWEQHILSSPLQVPSTGPDERPEFIVARNGGLDQIWSPEDRRRLTYCVSASFGGNHAPVAAAMINASAAWEAVADLDFIYLPTEDGDCNPRNDRVMFDVSPRQTNGAFYALAFFPNEPRLARSLHIDPISFALNPNRALTLDGILRHEIGHIIGARHEHLRPEAGKCFSDAEWRAVTNFDANSVMLYPHCGPDGGASSDATFRLTAFDMNGAACIYGPAVGFVIDTTICTPAGGIAATANLQEFGPFDIAQGDTQMIAMLPVTPGSPFSAEMAGEGDPDLYVKFDGQALPTNYDCRPFEDGAAESCVLTTPEGRSLVSITVHGYAAGRFTLTVSSIPPDE